MADCTKCANRNNDYCIFAYGCMVGSDVTSVVENIQTEILHRKTKRYGIGKLQTSWKYTYECKKRKEDIFVPISIFLLY